jgi:hypothetical protein
MGILNIINYNPNVEEDKINIEKIINLCNDFKDNISKVNYKPYKNFVDKLNRFIVLITSNFKKELEEYKIENTFFDKNEDEDEDEDDNISIASISEYDEEEQYEDEKENIIKFENKQKHVYETFNNLYDIEIE